MSQPAAAPRRVRRRDGTVVSFDGSRIEAAVTRAAREAGHRDPALAAAVAAEAGAGLAGRFGRRPPGVEDVQDAVEQALMTAGSADVARAYSACRCSTPPPASWRRAGAAGGASMAVLNVSHPDICEFIDIKQAGGLEHFNLSVAVTGRFLRAVTQRGQHRLVSPRTGRVVARVPAAEPFDRIWPPPCRI